MDRSKGQSGGAMTATVPLQLGKFRIVGHLGRGGMAEVFLAVASGPGGFNKLHVLKQLRRDAFDNEESLRMFVEEARLTALLNHPNVVQTHEIGEDQGTVFMVMEYLEGQSLDSILRRAQRVQPNGGFDLGLRVRVLSEILCGLHYAHELKDLAGRPLRMVHRDVSPHNILVTYDGSIKLLDFGVAKTTSTSSPTRSGTLKGKVAYMAPEQVHSPFLVSRCTDVFQVGVVLWEGVIQGRFWQNSSEYEILLRLSTNDLPELTPPPGADPELVRICQRAMAVVPDSRYATAEEFHQELEAYMVLRNLRVAPKDVGAEISRLFRDRRAEVEEAIQLRLKNLQNAEMPWDSLNQDPAMPFLPHVLSDITGTATALNSSAMPLSAGASYRTTGTGSGTRTPITLPSEISRFTGAQWSLAKKGVALGAGLGLIAALVWLTGSNTPGESSGIPPVPSSIVFGNSPDQIEILLEAFPDRSRLFLDNAPLPTNPFRGRVPRDGAVHFVRAESEGFETASMIVRFERDATYTLRLSSSPRPGNTSSPLVPHPKPPRQPYKAPPPSGPPTPRATTPHVPSVPIDTTDPWQ